MNLHDKVAVVTGGASGIGRALCRRFAAEGARGVVVADVDADGASEVAREIGGLAVRTDVAVEREVVELVRQTIDRYGQLDLFCSNAGIFIPGGVDVANSDWRRIWDINVCQGRSKFGPLRRSKSRPVGEGVAVFVGRLERSLRSPFRAAQA